MIAETETIPETNAEVDAVSLYRTMFLMAHNRLHGIVHSKEPVSLPNEWEGYLKELESSEAVAATPA
jgi:hypothetical protein